jgi:SSS family solute:Na+ symporter
LKEGLATADMLRAQYGVLFSLQQIHWLYYAEALLILCMVLVLVISMVTKAPEPGTVRYTYYGATAEEKAATRASWNYWDVVHSAIIVAIIAVFYYSFW